MDKEILLQPKDPPQIKSLRRQNITSKHVNITGTPIEMPKLEPMREVIDESQRPLKTLPKMVPNSILEPIEENWVKSLWEEVWKANETTYNKGKALISQIDLNKKQAHVDMVTRYADTQSSSSNRSKALSIKELHSFIKPERCNKEVL